MSAPVRKKASWRDSLRLRVGEAAQELVRRIATEMGGNEIEVGRESEVRDRRAIESENDLSQADGRWQMADGRQDWDWVDWPLLRGGWVQQTSG